MNIIISSGKGTGPTELAAFDSALASAGVSNFNLLCLSSVIPPASEIKVFNQREPGPLDIPGDWGDRLYVVMAEQRESIAGKEAWAGIGWVQESESGKGLFVEHHADSEARVRADITASLTTLQKTRNIDFGKIHMILSGATCNNIPVCALVVAVYESSKWVNRSN